jgi:hypothetical protein
MATHYRDLDRFRLHMKSFAQKVKQSEYKGFIESYLEGLDNAVLLFAAVADLWNATLNSINNHRKLMRDEKTRLRNQRKSERSVVVQGDDPSDDPDDGGDREAE